jgi:hypothetical protein
MTPYVDLGGLRKTHLSEYALRFVFGGVVTAATGVIAHRLGPSIGGLFLAFPAILPASLMLLRRHDGRREAAAAARGACLGASALAAFAATALVASRYHAPISLTLAAATAVWIVVAAALWRAVFGRREHH